MSRLLSPKEAAEYLGISGDTLAAARIAGEVPYVNIGRGDRRETPRYDPDDLDAWKVSRKKVAARPAP